VILVSLSSLQLSTTLQCIQTPLDLPHNALLAVDAVPAPILPAVWHALLCTVQLITVSKCPVSPSLYSRWLRPEST